MIPSLKSVTSLAFSHYFFRNLSPFLNLIILSSVQESGNADLLYMRKTADCQTSPGLQHLHMCY